MANSSKRLRPSVILRRGEPFVWATSAALTAILMMAGVLTVVVLANGLATFWPKPLVLAELEDGGRLLGELTRRQEGIHQTAAQTQFKVGNRELYGLDFRWVDNDAIVGTSFPPGAITVERMEYGNFYGFLSRVETAPNIAVTAPESVEGLVEAWRAVMADLEALAPLDDEIRYLTRQVRRLELAKVGREVESGVGSTEARHREELDGVVAEKEAAIQLLRRNQAVFTEAGGRESVIPLIEIVRFHQPNTMSLADKWKYYGARLKELFLAEPRESNTEGGLYPAIFGTVILVFLMSVLSFPLGIIAGIYLREYAKEGPVVRLVRIAVNNLAGIPSIVYGIFGLGFFVYGVGGTIDNVFFSERLPTPTFGTGGILWASLTLGLLTVPVVIVATEEALGAIPHGIRQGSLSLGATRFQTLYRILIPMASPGIMTGFILAMARAAGEVAPLMITGVVKLAPALPVDGQFPFVHLDRKFMHLGFHIYDIGFQSPNVEAAKPMVFVTTLLLVLIVMAMSSLAIYLRNRIKKKYTAQAI